MCCLSDVKAMLLVLGRSSAVLVDYDAVKFFLSTRYSLVGTGGLACWPIATDKNDLDSGKHDCD